MKVVVLAAIGIATACAAFAQQQEQGMLARIESARPDSTRVNPMQNQSFSAPAFGTKAFNAARYEDVKPAGTKPFATRSFFGIKNPWFGREVFATPASALGAKQDRAAAQSFRTGSFGTADYDSARRDYPVAPTTAAGTQPRPTSLRGKTQEGIDRFTENLEKDLTIDDVRDLLNKGKGG